MKRRTFLQLSTGAAVGSALAACGGGGARPALRPPPPDTPPAPATGVTVGWNRLASAVMITAGTPPTIASRILAIMHTAMYDAWAAYDAVALSTRHGATLRRPLAERTPASQVQALSVAAHAVLRALLPGQRAAIDAHQALLGYDPGATSASPLLPAGIGALAAAALLAWRAGDGANQDGALTSSGIAYADYTSYVARNAPLLVTLPTPRSAIADPSHWQPLSFTDAAGAVRTQSFLTPFWGQVRPFALSAASQFRPGPPALYGSAAFAHQVDQVVAAQQALTDRHKAMIEYWTGSTSGHWPTGLWGQAAAHVSSRDNHSEGADVKMYFAMANAQFDAGIAAWDAKRAYDSVRPITAIRYLLAGQNLLSYGPEGPAGGLRLVAGEAWMPYQLAASPTPAHPDYVSGHSALSAAAAEALKCFTGSDTYGHGVTVAARSLRIDPATPARDVHLSWPSFTEAACEAGQSRILGGIHFPQADSAGRQLGAQVAAVVHAKAAAYWNGQA